MVCCSVKGGEGEPPCRWAQRGSVRGWACVLCVRTFHPPAFPVSRFRFPLHRCRYWTDFLANPHHIDDLKAWGINFVRLGKAKGAAVAGLAALLHTISKLCPGTVQCVLLPARGA
jgi:hypothetical protein